MNLADLNPEEGQFDMPNGYRVYWRRNEAGGRTYISDDIGGGVMVFDSALQDPYIVQTAMMIEVAFQLLESRNDKRDGSTIQRA